MGPRFDFLSRLLTPSSQASSLQSTHLRYKQAQAQAPAPRLRKTTAMQIWGISTEHHTDKSWVLTEISPLNLGSWQLKCDHQSPQTIKGNRKWVFGVTADSEFKLNGCKLRQYQAQIQERVARSKGRVFVATLREYRDNKNREQSTFRFDIAEFQGIPYGEVDTIYEKIAIIRSKQFTLEPKQRILNLDWQEPQLRWDASSKYWNDRVPRGAFGRDVIAEKVFKKYPLEPDEPRRAINAQIMPGDPVFTVIRRADDLKPTDRDGERTTLLDYILNSETAPRWTKDTVNRHYDHLIHLLGRSLETRTSEKRRSLIQRYNPFDSLSNIKTRTQFECLAQIAAKKVERPYPITPLESQLASAAIMGVAEEGEPRINGFLSAVERALTHYEKLIAKDNGLSNNIWSELTQADETTRQKASEKVWWLSCWEVHQINKGLIDFFPGLQPTMLPEPPAGVTVPEGAEEYVRSRIEGYLTLD